MLPHYLQSRIKLPYQFTQTLWQTQSVAHLPILARAPSFWQYSQAHGTKLDQLMTTIVTATVVTCN